MRRFPARDYGGAPDSASVSVAVAALRAGELVILPTDTVYGLAADGLNAAAVAQLFTAKQRPREKVIALLAASPEQAAQVADLTTLAAQRLIARWWPGALTIVATARTLLPDGVGIGGTVGVRVPDDAVLRAVAAQLGHPLAVTSANRSGDENSITFEAAVRQLAPWVAVALDGGPCPIGVPSTVADITSGTTRVLRQGSALVEAPVT